MATQKPWIEMTADERKAAKEARLKDPVYHDKLKKTLDNSVKRAESVSRSQQSAMAALEKAEARLQRVNSRAEEHSKKIEKVQAKIAVAKKAAGTK